MRTLSESLARLAELLPKVDVECQSFERFGFVRLLVFTQKPHSILIESFEIDAASNVESHDNAGALERLSDLVYEKTGWVIETGSRVGPESFASLVSKPDCVNEEGRYLCDLENMVDTALFPRCDQASVEAIILAIEKHLEEK